MVIIIELLYVVCAALLSLYGLNSLVLTWLYFRHRSDPLPTLPEPAVWPSVTVQLPLYNEVHTVERLLQAAAALNYPRDRLEIQILDDSSDATRTLAARTAKDLQRQGVDVVHLTRAERTGFKGGALAAGLAAAKGEFLAIFDADFVPPPDFLQRVLPEFADPRVGCVQTRWGHLNRDYSLLTQVQALGLDGHFVVEQTARSRSGLFLNFNGSAGIWRRRCIEEAGGWAGDTLTEDLDLSYRAQLRGWRIAYRPDVVVPAELPVQMSAFKHQQARWAQGSIQTALKLTRLLLCSPQSCAVKLEAVIHLTGYVAHPLILSMGLLTLPMRAAHSWVLGIVPWLMAAAVGPPLLYGVAQFADGGQPLRRLRALPGLVLLGTGIALSNTCAVLRAVLRVRQGFQRTPKFAVHDRGEPWAISAYALGGDTLMWAEAGLALWALGALAVPGVGGSGLLWALLYAGGFGSVAGAGLLQAWERRRWLLHSRR
jgi:cellulose synthase/poly-beta-1,6-N-acetylglucosamine synthase-like glycosyltransferase